MTYKLRRKVIKLFFDVLRNEGFEGSGYRVRRFKDPIIHVVEVQSERSMNEFYINMGVHIDSLRFPMSIKPIIRNEIEESNCYFRQRLSPYRNELGWNDPTDDAEVLDTLDLLLNCWSIQGKEFFSSYKYPQTFEEMISRVIPSSLSSFELLKHAYIAMQIKDFQAAFILASRVVDRMGVPLKIKQEAQEVIENAKNQGAIDPADLRKNLNWSE